MLRCIDIARLGSEIIDNTLNIGSRVAVFFHLIMCRNCRTHVNKMRILKKSLAHVYREEEPPLTLTTRVQTMISAPHRHT